MPINILLKQLHLKKDSNNRLFFDIQSEKGVRTAKHYTFKLSKIDDKLILGRGTEGLWQLNNDYTLSPYLADKLKDENVTTVEKDRAGNLWIGAFNKLIRIDPSGKRTDFTEGLPNFQLLKLYPLSDGKIVFITELHNSVEEGLYILDPVSGKCDNIGKALGISSSPSFAMEDLSGNIWFTTTGNGIYCIYKKSFKQITTKRQEPFYINIIARKNDHQLWVGTKADLLIYDELTNQLKPTSVTKPVWTMSELNSKLYFHTPVTYDKNLNKTFKSARKYIHYDNGDYYGVLYHNLFKSTKIIYSFPSHYSIKDACYKEGKIYTAAKQGLFLLEFENPDSLKLVNSWNKSNGLPASYVNNMDWQGDTLWLATEGGAAYLINGKVQALGGPTSYIKCERVLVDHRNTLWFGTPKGLISYDGEIFTTFNTETGLVADDVTFIYEDSLKQLWVGSSVGVTQIDNSQKQMLANPPPLYLQFNDSSFSQTEKISIAFQAINFETPSSTTYQYRLDGGAWQYTQNQYVEYNALSAGNHSFQVRAKKLNSSWSESQTLSFKVVPPWYLHWIAFVFYISLFLFSVFLFASLRIRKAVAQSRRLQREINHRIRTEKQLAAIRDQIAKDFHDEMGNKLASITVLSNLIKFQLGDMSESISELANKIEASSKDLYAGTKDFIWAIKARSDNLDELIDYLRNFGENFFHPMGVDFYVEVKGTTLMDNYKLPLGWSRQLVLILKEAMTNAGKYAECKSVKLTFNVQQGNISINLSDSGIGFDETLLHHINGLNNMRNRAENIGAELFIESQLNQGTSITFLGKLEQRKNT